MKKKAIFFILLLTIAPLFGQERSARVPAKPIRLDIPGSSSKSAVVATLTVLEPQVKSVSIRINGDQSYLLAPEQGDEPAKLVLNLRPYGNEVSVETTLGDGSVVQSLQRVYVENDTPGSNGCGASGGNCRAGERYALIIEAEAITSGLSQSLDDLLTQSENIPRQNIVRLKSPSAAAVRLALVQLRKRTNELSQVLLSFSGESYYSYDVSSPVLKLQGGSDGDLSLIDLVSNLQQLEFPATSVLLNTQVEEEIGLKAHEVPSAQTRQSRMQARIASLWSARLQMSRPIDLLLASQGYVVDNTFDFHEVASSVLSAWKDLYNQPISTDCVSLRTLFDRARQAGYLKDDTAARANVFLLTAKPHGFCFIRPQHGTVPVQFRSSANGQVELRITDSAALKPGDLLIVKSDGVIVKRYKVLHQSVQDRFLLNVAPGLSWLEAELRHEGVFVGSASYRASDPIRNEQMVLTNGSHFDLRGLGFPSENRRIATSLEELALDFVVKGSGVEPITYTVLNNGSVIERRTGLPTTSIDLLQVHSAIPLSPGVNNVTVRAMSATGEGTERHLSIDSHRDDPIVGAIIGIDEYVDAGIPPLRYSAKDAKLFSNLLVRYTPASSRDIVELENHDATLAAISNSVRSIAESVVRRGKNISETNFVFYYSGQGRTFGDYEHGQVRCIFASDTKLDRMKETCLSEDSLAKILDEFPWKNVLVVLDTSYEGRKSVPSYFAGKAPAGPWRPSESFEDASKVRRNRLILTANSANSPALEDSSIEHGLFTYALSEGVKALSIATADLEDSTVTIESVYQWAQQYVERLSRGRQIPVLQGTFSSPFGFRRVDKAELKARTSGELALLMQRALIEIGAVSTEALVHDLNKRLDIDPQDIAAYVDLGNVEAAAGRLSDAAALIEKGCTEAFQQHDDGMLQYCLTSKANLSWQVGDQASANKYSAEATKLRNTTLRTGYVDAEVLLASGDYKAAADRLDSLLESIAKEAPSNEDYDPKISLTADEKANVGLMDAIALVKSKQTSLAQGVLSELGAEGSMAPRGNIVINVARKVLGLKGNKGGGLSIVRIDTGWQRLLALFVLGKISQEELAQFKEAYGSNEPRSLDCTVNFYSGLREEASGKTGVAHYLKALENCERATVEFWISLRSTGRRPQRKSQPGFIKTLQDPKADVSSRISAVQQLEDSSMPDSREYLGMKNESELVGATLLDLTRHSDQRLSSIAKRVASHLDIAGFVIQGLQSADLEVRVDAEALAAKLDDEDFKRALEAARSTSAYVFLVNSRSSEYLQRLVPTASDQGDRYYVEARWQSEDVSVVDCLTKLFNRELISHRTMNQEKALMKGKNRRLVYWYSKDWALHIARAVRECGATASFVPGPSGD
jgi:hypothetical protein